MRDQEFPQKERRSIELHVLQNSLFKIPVELRHSCLCQDENSAKVFNFSHFSARETSCKECAESLMSRLP